MARFIWPTISAVNASVASHPTGHFSNNHPASHQLAGYHHETRGDENE
jgi:hypothetical protein